MFDHPIILIIVVVAALLRWLSQKSDAGKPDPERPTVPGQPIPRGGETQTEEERIRRFLEALGQPAGSTPPPKGRAQAGNKATHVSDVTSAHYRPTAAAHFANSRSAGTSASSDPTTSLHARGRARSGLRSARSRRANIKRFGPGASPHRRGATRPPAQAPVDAGSAQRDCSARNFRTTTQFAGLRLNQRQFAPPQLEKGERTPPRAHPDCARGIR